MTHVTEDAEHAQRAKNATEGEATDLRFVACIHTAHGWPYGYTTPAPNTLTATGAALIHRRTED